MNDEFIKIAAELHNMGMKVTGGRLAPQVLEEAEKLQKATESQANTKPNGEQAQNDNQ